MADERKRWQDPSTILKSAGVREGMTLADLGCGPGFFTLPMASFVGNHGTVYAVDANPVMLEHLRENLAKARGAGRRVRIVESDVCDTGIPTGSVDLAFFANILHDVDDKASFLKEVRRICRRGAMAVDVDWKRVRTPHGPPLEIRLGAVECRRILSEGGLTILRRFDAGPYHYGLMCRR